MKNNYNILFCFLSFLFLACASNKKNSAIRPVVSVSIAPIKYFVEAIGGEEIQVNCLVKDGFSPANYQPTTKQLAQLQLSSAYLAIGPIGFEQQWLPRFEELFPQMRTYVLSEGVNELQDHCCSHGSHADPHIWTSPINAKVICQNIAESLSNIDTLHQNLYKQRCDSVIRRIEQLDLAIRKKLLTPGVNKVFAIYHPSLTYFANHYGLKQIPLEKEGKSPSVSQITDFIKQCKEKKVALVFIQKEFSHQQLVSVADNLGIKKVQINPLSYYWEKEIWNIVNSLCHE